ESRRGHKAGVRPAKPPRPPEPVDAGGMELLDQRFRQPLLSLDLVAMAPDDRPQCSRGLHEGLRIDVGRQEALFRDLPHWAAMFRWRTGGVKRYCRVSRARRLR